MAKRVTKWESDSGKMYNTELEAVKADVAYYKEQLQSKSNDTTTYIPTDMSIKELATSKNP